MQGPSPNSAQGAVQRTLSTPSAPERADDGMEQLAEKLERLSDKGGELAAMKDNWLADARKYVRQHPFASVGFAFGAGYLFRAIRRRRR